MKLGRRELLAMAAAVPSSFARAEMPADLDASGLQAVLDSARSPGVAAAVIVRDLRWQGAAGFANLETRRAMSATTPVYIGSVSKPLTAALALLLAEEGRLSADSRLVDLLPGWSFGAEGDAMALRHLLTHTAGLPREGHPYWFTGVFPQAGDLRRIASAGLQSAPGAEWQYSNLGYALIGQTLMRAGRGTYAELLRSRLCAPLGLANTGVGQPADLARAYTAPGRRTGRGGQDFAGHGARVGERFERVYHGAQAMTPAFGVHSTARDLGTFLSALLADAAAEARSPLRAINASMFTVQHPFDDGGGWTFGLRATSDAHGAYLRHNGWFAAYRSHVQLRPDRGTAVAVVANADDSQPEAIGAALFEVVRGLT
ncbi:MAG: serine hydrolase domain-containing protein [Myxococcota bacterium]